MILFSTIFLVSCRGSKDYFSIPNIAKRKTYEAKVKLSHSLEYSRNSDSLFIKLTIITSPAYGAHSTIYSLKIHLLEKIGNRSIYFIPVDSYFVSSELAYGQMDLLSGIDTIGSDKVTGTIIVINNRDNSQSFFFDLYFCYYTDHWLSIEKKIKIN